MGVSNNQIRKLGKKIRENGFTKECCSKEDLELLQKYRLDHKESLDQVFFSAAKSSKAIHSGRIATFRLKRIDTILSKLKRESGMELDRMWDVAGCRIIVQSVHAIKEIAEQLKVDFEVKRTKDSIDKPDEDGYKGLHLYLKPKDLVGSKTIEVQLRTFEHHHWATLVEVVDVVFNTKIKEGDTSKPELNKFLTNFSKIDLLSIEQRMELIRIETKHNIYSQLADVFIGNIGELRNEWISLKGFSKSEAYVLFSINNKTKQVKFKTFENIEDAETSYLDRYLDTEQDYLISFLDVSSFTQLALAYSNYVLSSHKFLDSWLSFIAETSNILAKNKKVNELETLPVEKYMELVTDIFKVETEFISKVEKTDSFDRSSFFKIKSWKGDRDKVLNSRRRDIEKVKTNIKNQELAKKKRQDEFMFIVAAVTIIGLLILIFSPSKKKNNDLFK